MIPLAKRKRTKKEAQERIPRTPRLPGTDPRIKALNAVLASAELGARALIELDPLNRLSDGSTPSVPNVPPSGGRMDPRRISSIQRLADVVNDPAIVLDDALVMAVNEPSVMMSDQGEMLVRASPARRSRQFERQNILPRTKRTRKKNGNDKKLSKAFKEANAKLRTKSGKLRKGKTQADVARLAQRLRKKMK